MSAPPEAARPAGGFATVAGVAIHFHELGEGPPLVLLHGSGPGASGWSNFSRNAHELAKTYRVIVPDLPGFGGSDMKPVGVPVPGWWADIIAGLLETLKIEAADFVGNSMGGMIALKLALEKPALVKRLVLMGTGGGLPLFSPFPTEGVKALVGFYENAGPSAERLRFFIGQCVYDQSVITDALIAERLAAVLDPRIVAQPPMRPGPAGPPEELWRDARLARLPHDVLLIWGREDRVMPLDNAFALARQIPKARLLVLPHCGHWVQWERAAAFNRFVSGFLDETA